MGLGDTIKIDFEGHTFKLNKDFVEQKQADWLAGTGERFLPMSTVKEVYLDLVEFTQMKNPSRKDLSKAMRA